MADRSEIIDEIEALAVHCRPPIMEPAARASWLRDWCDDLAGFPISAVRLGCRAYRQSGQVKFPTAGQLLPMVRANLPVERAPPGATEPWRPISDAEYEALSLREKIRHREVMAREARRKAGPMWKNPPEGASFKRPVRGHVRAEDMPEAWRIQSQIAAEHEEEARRLRSHLHRREAAA